MRTYKPGTTHVKYRQAYYANDFKSLFNVESKVSERADTSDWRNYRLYTKELNTENTIKKK